MILTRQNYVKLKKASYVEMVSFLKGFYESTYNDGQSEAAVRLERRKQ